MKSYEIEILGSKWKLTYGNTQEFPKLKKFDGYCDSSVRKIIIDDMSSRADDLESKEDLINYRDKVSRHEIIHAYLAESGLDGDGNKASHWEHNEEMIDWFAIQSPKIFATFNDMNLL